MAGTVYNQGEEVWIQWEWNAFYEKPESVRLYLIDYHTGQFVMDINHGLPVQNTGHFQWNVNVVMPRNRPDRTCKIVLSTSDTIRNVSEMKVRRKYN